MNWLKNNWDKVLTAVLSVLVSGAVGFFTGILAVRQDMARLGERIATAETEILNIKPKMANLDNLSREIRQAQNELRFLRKQADIAAQTNKLLDLRIEQQRDRTLSDLRDILSQKGSDSGKRHSESK